MYNLHIIEKAYELQNSSSLKRGLLIYLYMTKYHTWPPNV